MKFNFSNFLFLRVWMWVEFSKLDTFAWDLEHNYWGRGYFPDASPSRKQCGYTECLGQLGHPELASPFPAVISVRIWSRSRRSMPCPRVLDIKFADMRVSCRGSTNSFLMSRIKKYLKICTTCKLISLFPTVTWMLVEDTSFLDHRQIILKLWYSLCCINLLYISHYHFC